jgi:hypothetical protein
MQVYEFCTVWRIAAPREAVFAALGQPMTWPMWWPEFVDVRQLAQGRPDGVGAVFRHTVRSVLPFNLTFRVQLTRCEAPLMQEARVVGELEGFGSLQLQEEDGVTAVRYLWRVRPTKRWMNLLSAARALFAWNHHVVMRRGARGLGGLLQAQVLSIDAHFRTTPVADEARRRWPGGSRLPQAVHASSSSA